MLFRSRHSQVWPDEDELVRLVRAPHPAPRAQGEPARPHPARLESVAYRRPRAASMRPPPQRAVIVLPMRDRNCSPLRAGTSTNYHEYASSLSTGCHLSAAPQTEIARPFGEELRRTINRTALLIWGQESPPRNRTQRRWDGGTASRAAGGI